MKFENECFNVLQLPNGRRTLKILLAFQKQTKQVMRASEDYNPSMHSRCDQSSFYVTWTFLQGPPKLLFISNIYFVLFHLGPCVFLSCFSQGHFLCFHLIHIHIYIYRHTQTYILQREGQREKERVCVRVIYSVRLWTKQQNQFLISFFFLKTS